jgi:tetratricopeptide (TPR) repeat protein
MFKHPWFTLALGAMTGIALGYVLTERQSVGRAADASNPPVASVVQPAPSTIHPPVEAMSGGGQEVARLRAQVAALEARLAASPDDPRLMTAVGNLYFDAGRWVEAKSWYERVIDHDGRDPDVLTDLAVVYRKLKQSDRSLELLDRALEVSPNHWQALYNKVVVLGVDLHREDLAVRALDQLRTLKAADPHVPDLEALEAEITTS